MNTYSPGIEGLEELQELLNPKNLEKKLAIATASVVWKLHSALRFEVNNRYALKEKKSIDSVLLHKSSSSVKAGKNFLEFGLEYKDVPIDLSKFRYSWEWGNINDPVKREGRVHSVEVVRGKEKTLYGKLHFGGFVPRKGKNAEGKIYRNRFGGQMFERDEKTRLPLHVLFGPSLANQIEFIYDTNYGQVGKVKENLTQFISDEMDKIKAKG